MHHIDCYAVECFSPIGEWTEFYSDVYSTDMSSITQRIESNPRSTCGREAVLPLHWTRAEQRKHAYGTYGPFHVHEVRLEYIYPCVPETHTKR